MDSTVSGRPYCTWYATAAVLSPMAAASCSFVQPSASPASTSLAPDMVKHLSYR